MVWGLRLLKVWGVEVYLFLLLRARLTPPKPQTLGRGSSVPQHPLRERPTHPFMRVSHTPLPKI